MSSLSIPFRERLAQVTQPQAPLLRVEEYRHYSHFCLFELRTCVSAHEVAHEEEQEDRVVEPAWWISSEPTQVIYEEVQCPGSIRPAIWCKPLAADPNYVILYLHGGGFAVGCLSSHRKVGGHLAKHTSSLVLLLDYRLVPENPRQQARPCQLVIL